MKGVAHGDALREAALGGRVRSTPFLEPAEADAVLAATRVAGVAVTAWGGYPGARRRVVTARPDHVPEAIAALAALYFPDVVDADGLVVALRVGGVDPGALGDAVTHAQGVSVICLDPPPAAALERLRVAGADVDAEVVPVERVASGRERVLEAVVPALRVDVLGARAFGVSRSYFAKGVAAGRVSLNGRTAEGRSEAREGDEVWAEGLGRFRVRTVKGETRKGNVKVTLEVERT
ncbi:MAG: RNA-binding protein [Trueperaceae bacterium]|nr:RNA-binding protein [Trueperaceae bacterium]